MVFATVFDAFVEELVKTTVLIALVLEYVVAAVVLFLYMPNVVHWFCAPLVAYVGDVVVFDFTHPHKPTAYL